MVKRRTGLDPLAYMGVEPSMPAQFVREGRNPTTTDYEGYNIGTVWIVKGTNAVFMLVDKALFIATWRQFTAGVSALNTLTGDVGGIVPATANNIDIFGSGPFVFTGNPGMSLLTLSDDGSLATQYDADIGSAIPVANIINIIGGPHVQTTAAGNTITISPMGSVAVSIPCDIGAAVPAGGILNVFGGNNITTTGAADTVTIDVTGTTDNALQRGNATGSLTSLVVGTDGQVVIGATGGAPAFATLASAGGTILFTPGANTLNLESAGTGALTSIPCDVGAAAPLLSVLNAFGGDNITTTGAGNTVTIAVSGTTQFAPQMGNAAGSLSDIGVMTTGELIIGVTGASPNLSRLTAGANITIDDLTVPGEIEISATGSAGLIIQQERASRSDIVQDTGNFWTSIIVRPTSSMGTQILSVTITPTNAASVLVIEANCTISIDDLRAPGCIFILQDAGVNALAAAPCFGSWISDQSLFSSTLKYYMTAGTVLPTTFRLRMTQINFSFTHFMALNGNSFGQTYFGGFGFSSLTVTGYAS